MKRIFISLLLCPLTIMAMEQQNSASQNNNESLHVGVVTHLVSEATIKGELYAFPCEEDMIVYTYNDQRRAFDYINRFTKNYIKPDTTNALKTLPKQLSARNIYISEVSLTKSDQEISAKIHYTSTIFDDAHNLTCQSTSKGTFVMGTAIRDIPPQNFETQSTSSLKKAIFVKRDSQVRYSPAATCKADEEIPFSVFEPRNPNAANELLRIPGPHPLSLVIAFLKLQKQNEEYVPVPN